MTSYNLSHLEQLESEAIYIFQEALEFRDNLAKKYNTKLNAGSVQNSIDRGTIQEEKGLSPSRNALQSITLLEKLEEGQYEAAMEDRKIFDGQLEEAFAPMSVTMTSEVGIC